MILNGSPQGPGFLIFFNILDTSRGFQRVTISEDVKNEDDELMELIPILLMFMERQ
jgi:hypothetical protein